jgi:hypothetical protein
MKKVETLHILAQERVSGVSIILGWIMDEIPRKPTNKRFLFHWALDIPTQYTAK